MSGGILAGMVSEALCKEQTSEQGTGQFEGERPVTICWETIPGIEDNKSKNLEVGMSLVYSSHIKKSNVWGGLNEV